jgi:hypothetical protein
MRVVQCLLVRFLNLLINMLQPEADIPAVKVMPIKRVNAMDLPLADSPRLIYRFKDDYNDYITEVLCNQIEFPIKIETDGAIYFKINRKWILQKNLELISIEQILE